jgi:hypothetical protein
MVEAVNVGRQRHGTRRGVFHKGHLPAAPRTRPKGGGIIDLAHYHLPTPPVPVRRRRWMLALGSGDPSRTICSTLIVETNARNTQSYRASTAFQIIRRRRATAGTNSCIFATTDYLCHVISMSCPIFRSSNPPLRVASATATTRRSLAWVAPIEEGHEAVAALRH